MLAAVALFAGESDVYLVRLGGAGLTLYADEQALRLRASNAENGTPPSNI
jgi:hypothetical protein